MIIKTRERIKNRLYILDAWLLEAYDYQSLNSPLIKLYLWSKYQIIELFTQQISTYGLWPEYRTGPQIPFDCCSILQPDTWLWVYWNQAQKSFTHPYAECPWVSVTLTLWPINTCPNSQHSQGGLEICLTNFTAT